MGTLSKLWYQPFSSSTYAVRSRQNSPNNPLVETLVADGIFWTEQAFRKTRSALANVNCTPPFS